MRRAGRKRRIGVSREKNGDVSRRIQVAERGHLVPPEVLLHRLWSGTPDPGDQRAGSALGRLLALGLISDAQHTAGQRLTELWQSWSCLACRPRFPVDRRNVIRDDERPDPEVADRWQRLSRQLRAVKAVVRVGERGRLAWSLLESVCADDVLPPQFDPARECGLWPIGQTALSDGLDAVGLALGITQKKFV